MPFIKLTDQEIMEYLEIPDLSGSEDSGEDSDGEDSIVEDSTLVLPSSPQPSTSSCNVQPSISKTHNPSSTSRSETLDLVVGSNSDTDLSDEETQVVSEQDDWTTRGPFHFDSIDHSVDIPVAQTQNLSPLDPPITYFQRFFNEEVMNLLVVETNRYASENNITFWSQTDAKELNAFLGIIIMMGLHNLPSIDKYWSSDPLWRVLAVAEVMTVKRFKKILQTFHVNDNSAMPQRGDPNHDKLYKLRPLITKFNFLFQNEAESSNSQSIDECMVLFKGRSSMKQYMPLKPTKRGYKVWARADSKTGYLYQFEIYTGKQEYGAELGLGEKVVSNLTCKLEGTKFHICFDNFFTSVKLMENLFQKDIFATGTIRANRKGLPTCARQKKKLKKHEHNWCVKDHVGYVQWQDTKLVHVVSTAFSPDTMITAKRTQKNGSKSDIEIPKVIAEYTKRMGGVDRFDQKRSSYETGRKSRKCWMRLFYFLLDAALVNSFILYNASNRKPKSQIDFRESVAKSLVAAYTSRKRPATDFMNVCHKKKRSINQEKPSGVADEVRFSDGAHLPQGLQQYKRCRYCSSKTNNKRSKIECSKCQVPLCITPCFYMFHQK